MNAPQPRLLYTAAQSRAIDRQAIDVHGLPGSLLMARAARAAFDVLLAQQPHPKCVQVLCGPGNNGGDGFLLAMLAQGRGIASSVLLIDGEPRSTDAVAALARARSTGVVIEDYHPDALTDEGVIVDAMLGTGIAGDVRPQYRDAIEELNALRANVLALDVPSGINSDTGAVCGVAVQASWTISFITAKQGLHTGAGAGYAGLRFCDDLKVPKAAFAAAQDPIEVLRLENELTALPSRAPMAHKGNFGRCLVVGGDYGMGGAIILAAEAALRTGLGLVRVATRKAHVPALLARRPEAMVSAVDHRNSLIPLLEWADAVVLGPGLGQEVWGEQMLHACLASAKPLLVDADALNLLATQAPRRLPEGSVITPHPGEAARLLAVTVPGLSSSDVQNDRFFCAKQLRDVYGATVVLKGNGSLIFGPQRQALCLDGNPGMASGGMGDVLSGIAGGLLAQGLPPDDAAALAVVLHARAGDRAAAAMGERGLLADDLAPYVAELIA